MKKLVLSISMFLIAATTFAQSEVVMCNPFFNLKVALCKVGGIDIVPNP